LRRKYYLLDVFTEEALAGNPLAIVLDCDGLDTERMQKIAREFNLSETVFVFDPRDSINTARLRIFTPAKELPFAGHPLIGTAVLLAELRAPELLNRQDVGLVLEAEIDEIACDVRHDPGRGSKASFHLPKLPEKAGIAAAKSEIAAALALAEEDIGFAGHEPSVYSAGLALTFVPITSRAAIARAEPQTHLFGAAFAGAGAYLYTNETHDPKSAYHARMFAPNLGVREDPATGSAVAALAGVLMEYDKPGDGDHSFLIEQGYEMDRPSQITLGLEVAGRLLVSAVIAGSAVILAQGVIDL
jgi:trans-2,3-dihydro-3-hydroxyanthranilate isomerase